MLKRLFTIIILVIQVSYLGAQMVYTDPAIPVNGKPLKIYFNTSLVTSDANFKNYSGDVYAHTGVTLKGVDWQKVVGIGWGDITEPKLTSLGSHLYVCLLYTSDAADEEDSVDLGGRRIIKNK